MSESNPSKADEKRRQALELLAEGARLLRSQRPEEALPPLERAFELAPHEPDIAVTLGGALVMGHQWSKAVAFLEDAVDRHPDNALLWINLAAAYLGVLELSSRKRQDQAIAAFERAIEIDPVAPSAHYNIALIYAERRDWEKAAHWFQAALRANPNDRDAAVWLKRARQMAAQPEDND
ncbi:MAG: tetratricopeptide repeat protein [Caldilineae bacterium]|nr:MAG: tetratricopeptide repeat protein [Caldilineae bacterium]